MLLGGGILTILDAACCPYAWFVVVEIGFSMCEVDWYDCADEGCTAPGCRLFCNRGVLSEAADPTGCSFVRRLAPCEKDFETLSGRNGVVVGGIGGGGIL